MAKKSIEHEITQLRDTIREHDRRYYVDAAPTISDQEYDKLLASLRDLEAAHPELVTPDSPTQRVGGEPIEGFRTVAHARPMLSIDNTYDVESLRKWAARSFEALDPKLAAIDEAFREGFGGKEPSKAAISSIPRSTASRSISATNAANSRSPPRAATGCAATT